MKNELTIMWKEEVQPSIEMLKDKINLEETEIKLCKSWLWTNKRTLEWISDLRNWFYHSDNWKFNCLPEMELIHPELFTEDKYPVKILDDFSKYYNSLIKYDYNLEENQKLNLITNIVYLQSYLKQKNFKYKFIDFGSVDYTFNLPIINELDKENIILIKNTPYRRNHPRHPTEKECIEISKEIYDSINR